VVNNITVLCRDTFHLACSSCSSPTFKNDGVDGEEDGEVDAWEVDAYVEVDALEAASLWVASLRAASCEVSLACHHRRPFHRVH